LFRTGIERAADRIRRKILVPDFRRHVQIGPLDPGRRDRNANRVLVAVHLGGIDVAIAELKRAFHRRAAGIAQHAECAEPEPRDAQPLGLQIIHDRTSKT